MHVVLPQNIADCVWLLYVCRTICFCRVSIWINACYGVLVHKCCVFLGCPPPCPPLVQTNLSPYGFNDEEIGRLLKQRPRPKPKPPSVEVAKAGGEKAAGQNGENLAEKDDGAEGKEDGAEGSESNRHSSEAPGTGDRPNVEVEEGPANGEDNIR